MLTSHLSYSSYNPLPDNALAAVIGSLSPRGFKVETDYSFSSKNNRVVTTNALAFAHAIHRTPDYTALTVLNSLNGRSDEELVQTLAQSAAPFHLIHRDEKFSFWFSNISDKHAQQVKVIAVEKNIDYSQLDKILDKYATDIKPQRIIDVKQGRDAFAHPKFNELGVFQLSLWALDVTTELLVNHFGTVVNFLHNYQEERTGLHIPTSDVTDIAIQLLGASVLADTKVLERDFLQDNLSVDELITKAYKRYPHYFRLELFEKWSIATNEAYKILGELRYSGFAPDMLRQLYIEAYPDQNKRKALGRYDTPLYLTRRILDTIPVEFLPPEQRVVADMTCGWGSFLIAGYERLSRITDMRDFNLRESIYGNDLESFAARLAGLGLLISTSEDRWQIDNENAATWHWLTNHQPNIIVGNPPFGGNRKTIQDQSSRYQKADQFLNSAINRLSPGGYLAMIMPQSFVAAESSPQIRKNLVEHCDIQELWELPLGLFPDAQANTVVLFAQKKANSEKARFGVRNRTLQYDQLNIFREKGVFTASNLVVEQASWRETSRKSENSKNTHIMDYFFILQESTWNEIRAHCLSLQQVSHVFAGAIIGKQPAKNRWKDYPNSKNVNWLTGADSIKRNSFNIVYKNTTTIIYPNSLIEPRKDKEHLLAGEKILLVSNANPSWGKRVKVGIERKGYYASDSFIVIVPITTNDLPFITHEVVAAVLDWKVSNAWLVEHLKHPKIPMRAVKNIPFPYLDHTDCESLTVAVQTIEEAIETDVFSAARQKIDDILRRAYKLDEATYERLSLVADWDSDEYTSLDTQVDPNARWKISGVVDRVDAKNGTITFWLSGFDELQTISISPVMPGWLLRSGIAFRTSIPRICAKQRDLENISWGKFFPQEYTYLNDEDLFDELTDIFYSSSPEIYAA